MLKFEENLKSSNLQFGFKPKVGCATAIYTLRSIINYFTSNGSTLTLCALDISKAFDKVDHYALYMSGKAESTYLFHKFAHVMV